MEITKTISELDQQCIWHPFTQMQTSLPPVPIVKAQGIYLYDEAGKSYIDAISSWWVNLHGHAHPYISEKIKAQADLLEHVLFAGFTHPPAVTLASRLLSLFRDMSKVFYSDNGSTAVETALKMAIQYWHNKNPATKKIKVVCLKNGYHGDTFGAMSAAGKNDFNKPFWKHLFEIESIEAPVSGKEEVSLTQMKKIVEEGKVACFIFEPLILGVGGMIIYSPEGLDALLKLCREHHVITIADEVMTGFGRTGTLFACDVLNETPDIICLAKGLSGGFLPIGATICKQHIYDAFLSDHLHQALLHGHTYTGNPLACAAALASLDLLLTHDCKEKITMITESHKSFVKKCRGHPKIRRCESLGTILILEYETKGSSSYFQPIRNKIYRFFLDHGILLRPFGNVIHLIPPYCILERELKFIYEKIEKSLEII